MNVRVNRGVTLVELLVVLGIIGVLTAVVISSRGSFNKTILLTNTAFDVALTIRSAGTFGQGSRVTSANVSNSGYGVHFTPGASFTLFADTNPTSPIPTLCHPASPTGPGSDAPNVPKGNCAYDVPQDEVVQTYALGNGMKISDICAYEATLPPTKYKCAVLNDATHSATLTSLDVVFSRPYTATFFSMNGVYDGSIVRACVTLTSPQGGASHVYVEPTGQVHVSSAACP